MRSHGIAIMKKVTFGFAALLLALALPLKAYANDTLPITTASLAGDAAMAPIGWIGFCKKKSNGMQFGDTQIPPHDIDRRKLETACRDQCER